MIRNVGKIDKNVRIAAGAALLLIGILLVVQSNMLGLLLGLVGVVLLGTGFMNFCPIYRVVGMSTCPDGKC